jgi:hypothetical protein
MKKLFWPIMYKKKMLAIVPNVSVCRVEELIVDASLVSLQSKNTNNAKSEVRFKQLIRDDP